LPPKESLRSLVSFESQNGIWLHTTFVFERALMQFPRARRERLMFAPSINQIPLLLVLLALSDPARSMRESLPYQTSAFIPRSQSHYSTAT